MIFWGKETWRRCTSAAGTCAGAVPLVSLALCFSVITASAAGAVTEPAEEFAFTELYEGWVGELAVGPEGNMWFLQASGYPDGIPGWLERMEPNGTVTGTFDTGRSHEPVDLTAGTDGNVWFTTRAEYFQLGTIGRITPLGQIEEWMIPNLEESYLGGGRAIAAGADGSLWFTVSTPNVEGKAIIGRVTPMGNITEYPVPSGGEGLPVVSEPVGIALGADGNMWFTDDGHDREGHNLIGRITPTGSLSEFPIPTVGADPVAIALGSDGNMWFTEPGASKVARITPAGQITEFSAPSVGGGLNGLVRGSDGNMWFSGAVGVNWVNPEGVVRTLPATVVGNGGHSLAAGVEGDIWFIGEASTNGYGITADGYVGRFRPPKPPTPLTAPTLTGEPTAGHLLSVSPGSWSQEPAEITYQWQRCESNGSGCTNISGASTQTYFMSVADVGHRLRVVVTASDIAGSEAATSATSEPVSGPSAAPVPTQSETPSPAAQALAIDMTWRFAWTTASTAVRQLAAQGVPVGTRVEIACRGRGCPFAHIDFTASTTVRACPRHGCLQPPILSSGELTLTRLLARRGLHPSDQLVVRFTTPGALGRVFTFSIRRNQAPLTRTSCIAAGSTSHEAGC